MAILGPYNLVVTVRSATRIDMLWDNRMDYGAIEVWENKDGAGYGDAPIATISGTKEYYNSIGLDPNTPYCYKVRGIFYPAGTTAFCTEDCDTTWIFLEDPTNVVATPISDIEVDVVFKDNSADEDLHRLERKLGAGAWELVVNLEPNREFFRDGGLFLLVGGYTNCVETDIGKQVKDDGGEIGLLIAYDNVRRRWLVDSGSTIVNASVMTITGGTGAGMAARTTTGLVKGSSYTYQVRAEEGAVYSNWVASNQVTTIDVPANPTSLATSDVKDKSMRLSFTGVANETGYKIEKSDTGAFGGEEEEIAVIGIDITTFLVTGLDPNTQYWFRVRAYNAAGNSTYSNTATDTTLAVYVQTEFEKWIRIPKIKPIYLAEVYTKMTLTGFTLESGVVWKKTIGASDRGIDILEVFEDGDAYVEKTSIATVQATSNTFWFDYNNRILYIQTTPTVALLVGGYVDCVSSDIGKQVKDDGVEVGILEAYNNTTCEWRVGTTVVIANASAMTITSGTGAGTADGASGGTDPAGFLIEGAFWLYFSTHPDIEFTANGRLNHFLPLLSKEDIPSLSQEIKSYFEGNFGISSGAISFKNDELTSKKFFDKKFETYTWLGSKIILKAGKAGFTYIQFKEIFTAYIESKNCNDEKLTFQLRGLQKKMEGNILLNKFNITDYPGMVDEEGVEDKFIGKPISIGFGLNELVVPVAIDIENGKFKFNDHRLPLTLEGVRSKFVTEVKRNSVALVEDIHYYVDLQRSIITFNRDGAFIITAGVNDKIDFKEGYGSELNVTLTAGTYTTDQLLAQIKAKMEAANSLTFTVTCSSDPKKFKIAASGGFSLLWKTGTNGLDGTDTSVGTTIGFTDDEDSEGESSYEADEDVITITKYDILEVSFIGFVNTADEVIGNGAEIFKYLLNNYKEVKDSELNLDSIYKSKYANENVLSVHIDKEIPFNGVVRKIEHSIEAYSFQDELGRLGIRPQQTTIASKAKYIVSGHTFGHFQSKSKDSLFWKVIVYYNRNLQTDDWESKEATDNEVYWKYRPIEKELEIETYFSAPAIAQSLATNILSLLNKDIISNELPMLLFDVMAGDLIVFSRDRFFSISGTADEITLRIIKITKSPSSRRTNITAEKV